MSIVYVLPRLLSGRAVLELQNEYEEEVGVSKASASYADGSCLSQLITLPVELKPGRSRLIDISNGLGKLLQAGSDEPSCVRIHLSLNPRPPKQPPSNCYSVMWDGVEYSKFDPC